MLYDGVRLAEGSVASNMVIASGTSFPSNPDVGELFLNTSGGSYGLHMYANSAWNKVLTNKIFTSDTLTYDSYLVYHAGNLSFSTGLSYSSGVLSVTNAPTATTATNLAGGNLNVIPYQSAVGTTSFLAAGSSGQVLTSNGSGSAPSWQTLSTSTASNLSGGSAGEVVYQTGSGSTGFLAAGTSGQVLTSNGSGVAPTWQAVSASSATTATNLAGGSAGQVPYQSASGTTAFGNLVWSNASNSLEFRDGASTVLPGNRGLNGAAGYDLTIQGGQNTSSSNNVSNTGGNVVIEGGYGGSHSSSTSGTQVGGNVLINGGYNKTSYTLSGVTRNGGYIAFQTAATTTASGEQSLTERFRILANGAWSVGTGGTATGTSGQVLTSNGSGSAPTWQAVSASSTTATNLAGGSANVIPYQTASGTTSFLTTGTSGQVLTSNGSGSAPTWQAVALGNDSTIGTSTAVFHSTDSTSGSALTVRGGNASAGTGGNLTLNGGTSTSTNSGGSVSISGGSSASAAGGSVIINGGAPSTSGQGGSVFMNGGESPNTTGGLATIRGGKGVGSGGYISFETAPTTTWTERFRILANGAWSVGSNGTSTGTSGQVLTSNGSGSAPTWQGVTWTGGTVANAVTITSAAPQLTLGASGIVGRIISAVSSSGSGQGMQVLGANATTSGQAGGTVSITAGTGSGTGAGGDARVQGGSSTGGVVGSVTLKGGNQNASGGTAGDAIIESGTCVSGATPGDILFRTGSPTAGSANERFRIIQNGAWSVGSNGTSTGTSGQVLTSNGSGSAPTWQAVPSHTHSAADITSGTLAVLRGGTGVTTSTGTGNNVLSTSPTITTPSISGNMSCSGDAFIGSSGGGNLHFQAGASEANIIARAGVVLRIGQQFGQTADVHLYNGSNDRLTVKSSGNVGIGTTNPSERLHVFGNILASGTITPSSDSRLKKNIEPLEISIEQIASVEPVKFTRIADESTGLGIIAQDLERILPEAVLTADDENAYKSVSYGEASMVLLLNMAREMVKMREEIKVLKEKLGHE